MLRVSMLHTCTFNDKRNKLVDKKRKKWKGSVLNDKLAKDAKRGQASILSNKRRCLRRITIGLDRVSIIPLDWSIDETKIHA